MPLDNTQPVSNEAEYANFIPAGVRRAAERANQLSLQLAAAGQQPEPEPQPELTSTTVVEPATTVVEPAPVVTQPAPAPTIDWQQRYLTLQGKYNQEVPTLRGDVQRLTGQLEQLQASLAEMRTPPPAPATTVVPDADVDTYGSELVTAARRWARAEVAGELDELKREMGEIRSTTKTVQQDTAATKKQTVFQNTLSGLDADPTIGTQWRVVNDNPEFIAWLEQADPFTGTQRMALLRDAFGRGDVVRTGAFFKAYINEHTARQVPAVAQPTPQTETGRPTLGDFATPGRASGQAPGGAPADKRIWTQPAIAAFYRDLTKGAYRDKVAEAAKLEADIIAAAAEGRILK